MCASQWDTVNFNKNKVWNISIRLVAISFHHYLKFLKLAHDAFCKQTLHIYIRVKMAGRRSYHIAALCNPRGPQISPLLLRIRHNPYNTICSYVRIVGYICLTSECYTELISYFMSL